MREYQRAMRNFATEMLHDSPAAQRILALWIVRNIPSAISISLHIPMSRNMRNKQRQRPVSSKVGRSSSRIILLTRYTDLDRIEMALQGKRTVSYD